MRRALVAGVVLVSVVLAARSAWRTPTVALVRLKMALDRHDLEAVMDAVDTRALADQALSALLEEPAGDSERVRLVVRGEGAWLPAVSSARDYLRLRVERDLAAFVEDPEHFLPPVSWTALQRSIATLRRSGAVAQGVVELEEGKEYVVRLRWSGGRWRIVAVERDGAGLLRVGAPVAASPACDCNPATVSPSVPATPSGHDERFAPADPLPLAKPVVLSLPPPLPRPRHRAARLPFARRMTNGSWTVQVSSTTDAVEAELEREWLAHRGEEAFVMPAAVRGTTWQRVLVGGYPTRAEAEAGLARLRSLDTAVP